MPGLNSSSGLGLSSVPKLFAVGEHILLASGETDSFGYLSLSALVLAASILPWCVCMGATFPFMMAYIRERDCRKHGKFQFSLSGQCARGDERDFFGGGRLDRGLGFPSHALAGGGGQFHHRLH